MERGPARIMVQSGLVRTRKETETKEQAVYANKQEKASTPWFIEGAD